jgi:hypothetical protein
MELNDVHLSGEFLRSRVSPDKLIKSGTPTRQSFGNGFGTEARYFIRVMRCPLEASQKIGRICLTTGHAFFPDMKYLINGI